MRVPNRKERKGAIRCPRNKILGRYVFGGSGMWPWTGHAKSQRRRWLCSTTAGCWAAGGIVDGSSMLWVEERGMVIWERKEGKCVCTKNMTHLKRSYYSILHVYVSIKSKDIRSLLNRDHMWIKRTSWSSVDSSRSSIFKIHSVCITMEELFSQFLQF